MFIAVKLWKDCQNKPAGIPDVWPAEVRELGDSKTPPGPDWIVMTPADLTAYKVSRQQLYDLWASTQVESQTFVDSGE